MRYICTVGCYCTMRQTETMPFAAAWVNPGIILIEATHTERRNIVCHPLHVKSKKK